MTSGDEPQLGGQDHDNAPMISGRGTKIIADARGAYLARNMEALIEAMSPAQEARFRRLVIAFVLSLLRPDRLIVPADSTSNHLFAALDDWVGDPNERTHQHVLDCLPANRYASATDPLLPHLIRIGESIRDPREWGGGAWGVFHMMHRRYTRTPYDWAVIYDAAHEWRFDAAWGILQGKDIGLLRLESVDIEARAADAPRWYRRGSLPMLTRLLGRAQWARFRHALQQQAFVWINQVPAAKWSMQDWYLIAQARKWMQQPEAVDPAVIESARAALHAEQRVDYGYVTLKALLRLFHDHPDELYIRLKLALTQIEGSTRVMTFTKRGDHPRTEPHPDPQAWHLEVAWAILNDHPITPLGDSNDRRSS